MRKGALIYHYTNLNAFIKILESKKLWATSFLQLNDTSELIYFVNYIENEVLKYDSRENNSRLKEKIIEVFRQVKSSMYTEQGYCFVTSFSKLCDDAAQWERYGDNGCGISIGFNYDKLNKFMSMNNSSLREVQYQINKKMTRAFYGIIERKTNEDTLEAFNELLLTIAARHKHKSFVQEKEVRIISTKYFNTSFNTRVINNTIKSYQEIDLAEYINIKFEDLIEEIVIGPRATFGINELFSLLNQNNVILNKVKIKKSDCPLR